jgi:predicted TIM-barrel fold metal-dependent hydrolase
MDVLAQLGAAQWTATDAARLQHALQRARFDLMGVASRRALAGDIAGGNAEVKAVVEPNPQMRGWVVVNPSYPELSAEEMRRYLSSPKWLGAILPSALCRQGIDTVACRELLNAYRRYTKPLLVHVPDEATVHGLEALAREFTTIKFVAAGAGGDDWQDCVLAAKQNVNIFLEPFTGGTHRGKLEAIFATLGPNRVLFASNFPDHNPGSALGFLVDAKLTDGEKQAVLTTNAVRLFGLARAAEAPAAPPPP